MSEQYGDIERRAAEDYLRSFNQDITYKDLVNGNCRVVASAIHDDIRCSIEHFNGIQDKGAKYRVPSQLSPHVVSLILSHSKDISMVQFDESSEPRLAYRIRGDEYPENGIWVSPDECKYENQFKAMVLRLQPGADSHFMAETKKLLCVEMAMSKKKIRKALIDGVHVPCKNGVYNRENHTFLEWDDPTFDDVYPDVAFTTKLVTLYNALATNLCIQTANREPWDYESFVESLFDDNPEKCRVYMQALWEITAHVISGDSERSMWFFVNGKGMFAGSGGKSSFLNALKAVCGETNICTNSLNELTDGKYSLAEIAGKTAILSDELEESSRVIENYACIKKIMRMEPIEVRRIYGSPLTLNPKMLMVQCCNQVPKFKGASESVFRCMRVLPFEKIFAKDKGEKQYIRDDYVQRREVSEYILRKCLEEVPIHYSEEVLEETSAKKSIMEESLPAIQFMDELVSEYPYIVDFEVIPAPMLYDMYSIWYETTNHTRTNLSSQTFWKQVQAWSSTQENWEIVEGTKKITMDYSDFHVQLDVFYDYPPNTDKRKWVTDEPGTLIQFKPTKKTFRNGLRYTGTPRWMSTLFLKHIVMPDVDGIWHKEYEKFCQIVQNVTTWKQIPSYESWVWKYGCANYFDKPNHRIIRQEADGTKTNQTMEHSLLTKYHEK